MFWPNVILYGTLAVCTLLTVWIIKRYDLYDHEPWWYLLLAALVGAGGMHLSGHVQIWFIMGAIDRHGEATDLYMAILAGTIEEAFKLAAVALVAVPFRKQFNEPLDGIVLGSFAGLGAALEESVHVLRQIEPITFLPPQEPIRLAGHLVMGGVTCFGLGMLTMPGRRKWHAAWAIPVCFAIGAGMHTAWDITAFSAAVRFHASEELLPWHTWVPVGLMLVGLALYRGMVGWGASLTRYVLQVCDVRTKRCPPPLR